MVYLYFLYELVEFCYLLICIFDDCTADFVIEVYLPILLTVVYLRIELRLLDMLIMVGHTSMSFLAYYWVLST
jgi:hypothetical protein